MEKIYLASASPRRVELLKNLTLPFEQKISNVLETVPGNAEPAEYAEALALAKARDVAGQMRGGIVIGADTIVVYEKEILGKPRDKEDAVRMLRLLSGKIHQVISGVAVINAKTGRELVAHEVTKVAFRSLSEEEIRCYADTGEPADKAGGYGIQGIGAILIEKVNGCYSNVVGLPLTLLVKLLKGMGLDIWRYIGKGGCFGGST